AEVTALAFRDDGEVLASSAADGSVKLWRIGEDSAALFGALSAHQSGVHTMAFSPGGDRLALGSLGDSSLKVWYVGESSEPAEGRDLAAYLRDGWCELEGRTVIFPPVTNHHLFEVRKFEAGEIPPRTSPPEADSLLVDLVEAECVRSLRARGTLPIETGTGMRMLWVDTIQGWVGETEVTQAQFASGGGEEISEYDGDNRPVENVGWLDAVQYCEDVTASELANGRLPEGYEYALPTEEQWLGYVAGANEAQAVFGQQETSDVKSKPPNRHGLYDVRGNVWELTKTKHPSKPGYIARGGGFDSVREAVIGADYREFLSPRGSGYKRYGFRCVLVRKKTE
ncbi:MAG: SUMF1/EgtB/PvdO family nonheme iron enzyme, partial [Verrucomicrobiales bacterium]